MPSSAVRETPSPSASSIFLPLGRRARGDSKSSLSNPIDQDALNQALDTIHTAASQSQDLTVFNEYTDPPAPSLTGDNKGLAGELQGSLTGFYNKLKASVGAATADPSANETAAGVGERPRVEGEGLVSKPVRENGPSSRSGSGQVSRVQSPKLQAFESARTANPSLKSPSLSSKGATLPSKASMPTTQTLKSPLGGIHKSAGLIAEPIVSESNVNATSNSTLHSRNSSQYEGGSTSQDRDLPDGESLRRVISLNANDDPAIVGFDRRIASPSVRPLSPVDRGIRSGRMSHERGLSENSAVTRKDAYSESSNSQGLRDGQTLERSVAHSREISSQSNHTASDPTRYLAESVETISRSSTRVSSPLPRSPGGSIAPAKEVDSRLTQPRLPGFDITRVSSTDSALTTGQSIPIRHADLDGSQDHEASEELPRRVAFSKPRSKLLGREFWMRDENARDCFHCGEPFSTFRRKHHCRTCGQIFDHKCTLTVPGAQFGSINPIRVCKPCEAIIASRDEDSSDYSIEEISLPEAINRPHTPLEQQLVKCSPNLDDDTASVFSLSLEQMARTPTMSLPVRRALDSNNRNSAVLEFDVARPLPRPGSSRSLKTSHSISHAHTHGHGHKRHHSRHQHIRNFKAYHEERAPFQKRLPDDALRDGKQSAFHRDSIIDPDLAQYLSDDASSEEEQSVNINFEDGKLSKSAGDSERATIGGLLAAVRKGRSRIAEKSIASLIGAARDTDEASIASNRTPNQARPFRKRNLSVASAVHQRLTPRQHRDSLQIPRPNNKEVLRSSSPGQVISTGSSRMIRSASMRGATAPSMELNKASINHVGRLLQQLLRDEAVPHPSSWESALIPILLKATDDVDPDVQSGDDIDIRNYVKLKKVPGGRPGDTSYISGLVFTKNLALKSMPRTLSQPRILIITFSLEYARYEQHFMSLDPVIRQEREYLENLVGRITALQPDLLLAQRNVSGLALELLDKANIATAYNVKSAVLEAVSRCTQSRIIYSVDQLTSPQGPLGTCENFEVKTYVSDGRKKTYLYLSGCPPQLGCSVIIRGAERAILTKIKRITEFMVYVVYNLKLETCLMRDEFALIPSQSDSDMQDMPVRISKLADSLSVTNVLGINETLTPGHDETIIQNYPSDISNAEGPKPPQDEQTLAAARIDTTDSADIPDDIPVPKFYEDLVEKHQTKILSASPFVKFMQPYLLMRARELERRVAYLKRLRDQDASDEQTPEQKAKAQKFTLIQPEMVHTMLSGASKKVREILRALHDTEYDKALHNYETQKKQWEAYLSGNRNLFDPFAHQNIAVLFSHVSTDTSVPCSGPDVLAFSFYNEHESDQEFEADCTLGQYVEDLCYRADDTCPSNACEKKMHEHHRQYVHGEAQVSVFVQPYPAKMRGMQNIILMWSQCKICGVETPVIPMSASTWKYSFGKYLELSFWSADLHARAGICPHDLHRDHLRYFGYKDFALRVHYDPINLLEIIVPRLRITWKVDNDLRFRNDVYTKIENKLTRFMVSVKLRLKSINIDALLPENVEACRAEIDKMTRRANDEHSALIKQLQEIYANTKHWETIPLNHVTRLTQQKVAEWDNAFVEFESNFFPSEKDIRRLATLQLKKIFLDRDVSVTSLTSAEDETVSLPSDEFLEEKTAISDSESQTPHPKKVAQLSPEKTQSVLQSVVEEHSNPGSQSQANESDLSEPLMQSNAESPQLPPVSRSISGVQHLDLALPEHTLNAPVRLDNMTPSIILSPTRAPIPSNINLTADNSATKPIPDEPKDNAAQMADEEFQRTKPIDLPRPSNLPRAIESNSRRDFEDKRGSPTLLRSQSQPAGSLALRKEKSNGNSGTLLALTNTTGFKYDTSSPNEPVTVLTTEPIIKPSEKKLSDRLGLHHLKNAKFGKGHSLIPRSVVGRNNSRVSNLAKHFEQLSREFEKERVRERKLRANKNRQSRAYPTASSKPIVEVYKSVDEAVGEKDTYGEFANQVPTEANEKTDITPEMAQKNPAQTTSEGCREEEIVADATETECDAQETSRAASDVEGEDDNQSDSDDVADNVFLPDSPEDLLRLSQDDLDLKELPKHERTSLMKMLQNFWAERSSSGWTPLEYPLTGNDHVFADSAIIVREDEPSSIIAFTLDSPEYRKTLWGIQDHAEEVMDSVNMDGAADDSKTQADVMHSLLRKTGTHLRYQFQEGAARMTCKVFFAEQFDAVRRKCGVADRIVESLSRCAKWDSKGGKTKSLFLKTLDDRFVLKSLSTIETQSFLKFAPNYFQIMSEAFFHELPSVIAKMLGFYQIIMKSPVNGVEYTWNLLFMENLFYDRTPTRLFDLKGSMRNRKIQSTGERDEVLLDENMVEFIYESPLFTREHSKKLLRSSVHNDTLFLARQNVMDYSLMVAIDENRKELVVGIIDCIRTYTWDKKLESWIKDRGFAGGNKNRPTVTSPKEYKKRFREAMGRYVLEAPNCWYQFKPGHVEKRILKIDSAYDTREKDGDRDETELFD